MRDLLAQLRSAIENQRQVACCRLVETRGSTPQKAGAMMLVFADGSQAGTLGGGCVEAEVKRRALAVINEGTATVVGFQLDNDYGWDDGLVCGGRMHVAIDPLAQAASQEYFARLAQLVDRGVGGTEAIVFDHQASGLPAAASFLMDGSGKLLAHAAPGTIESGGTVEPGGTGSARAISANAIADFPPAAVIEGLSPLDTRPRPTARHGIAWLPILPRCRLVIVGGGHVGQAVGNLAANLDFDVWVIDDRADYVSEVRFPRAERRMAGDISQLLPKLEITPHTYCLIVTRGHNHDEQALYHLVDRGAAYVGMIGSRRKIKLIFEDLAAEGVSREALARVNAPVGLDIGSQTVPEIAISIAAELVAHRNCGEGKRSSQ